METRFTVRNGDENGNNALNLGPNKAVLAYLRPVEDDKNLVSCAWCSVTPQAGGSTKLPVINSSISAVVTVGNYTTAKQKIELQAIATITGKEERDVRLSEAREEPTLSKELCYVENLSPCDGIKTTWLVNDQPVCRSAEAMFNTQKESFQLKQTIYLTIGGQMETETFKLQDWTQLINFPFDNDLKSADIYVWLDPKDRSPRFKVANKKY